MEARTELQAWLELYLDLSHTKVIFVYISDTCVKTDQTVNSVNSVNFMKIREQRHSPSLWPWCMCQIAAARTPASHEIR